MNQLINPGNQLIDKVRTETFPVAKGYARYAWLAEVCFVEAYFWQSEDAEEENVAGRLRPRELCRGIKANRLCDVPGPGFQRMFIPEICDRAVMKRVRLWFAR